jgi:hypothetical protein
MENVKILLSSLMMIKNISLTKEMCNAFFTLAIVGVISILMNERSILFPTGVKIGGV